jgi:hypothetical protein
MKDAIEMNIHGIKCDACDYINEDVKVEEYINWVNKPCPDCSANLLTEEDYLNVQLLIQITNIMNAELPQREDDEKEDLATMTVKMNGTGAVDIEIKQ